MRVQVLFPHQLTSQHLEAWSAIQLSNSSIRSPYFAPQFTLIAAEVRRNIEVAVIEEQGVPVGFFPFQRLPQNSARPVTSWLSDFHGIISDASAVFDVEALLMACNLSSWDFTHLPMTQASFSKYSYVTEISPYMNLAEGFEGYRRDLGKSQLKELKKRERKYRQVSRDIGPIRLEANCRDPNVLNKLIEWKSARYRRSGLTNVFDFPWTSKLLHRLLLETSPDFGGLLSAIYINDRIAAIHMGIRARGTLHYWFTSYDRELSKHSPGKLLITGIARAQSELNIDRIDLGKGATQFKTGSMSDATLVGTGSVDAEPMRHQLRRNWWHAKQWIKKAPWFSSVQGIRTEILGVADNISMQ